MNRTKIDWADYTWNPVTGCLHGCPYCYADKQTARFSGDIRLNLAKTDLFRIEDKIYILDKSFPTSNNRSLSYPFGFKPTYHRYRLDWPQKVKNGANVFVGSMCDLFGEWISDEIIKDVFGACLQAPQHNYMFLTKNYRRYADLDDNELLPKNSNMWYGISVTNNNGAWKGKLHHLGGYNNFVSIEPLLEKISPSNIPLTDWVIIGAETHTKNRVIPQKQWIDEIVNECRNMNIPVFMKESLIDIMGTDFVQEFPEGLKNVPKPVSDKQKAKLFDKCSFCRQELPMKEMIALLSREKRGDSAKKLGYACIGCFDKLKACVASGKKLGVTTLEE